ncbi:hypothetical protein HPC49_46920 [Pyxidicoccus fallax]|uniref:Tle cognate immunity protein 4 C-terminal domain-containing protein n=1 Tax=Pyxidicoccus fallax TaxID=394095 RepID=A0A848M0N3_9BACT|nr:T6SS immunity protein Tli4 family protein [Pyxidicoccus fallax]NMO23093.1 hypothetical protein [Pyxidicoccus fallax]NPC85711.1 hypothetical protein [Pyxidicoccus fallax]
MKGTTAVLMLGWALAACSRDGTSQEESKMSQEPSKDFVRQCVGRFCLDVPASMTRLGDTFQFQYVEVEERLWEKPDDEARKRVFEARLAKIEALKSQRELPDDAQGTIREQRPFPAVGVRGVLFHRFDQPEIGTWGGLMARGPVDVWMQIDGDVDREQEWARRLTDVAAAYQLRDAKEPLPARGKDWFYLRQGVIALPMREMEEAKSRFEGHPLGLKLKVSTETVEEVRRQGLMDKLSNAMAMAGDSLGADEDLVTQKYGARKVAGLPGEELIVRTSEGKRKRLRFLWSFPGKEDSASHPKFTIEMETSLEQEEAKLAFWDALLNSVRPASQ